MNWGFCQLSETIMTYRSGWLTNHLPLTHLPSRFQNTFAIVSSPILPIPVGLFRFSFFNRFTVILVRFRKVVNLDTYNQTAIITQSPT